MRAGEFASAEGLREREGEGFGGSWWMPVRVKSECERTSGMLTSEGSSAITGVAICLRSESLARMSAVAALGTRLIIGLMSEVPVVSLRDTLDSVRWLSCFETLVEE